MNPRLDLAVRCGFVSAFVFGLAWIIAPVLASLHADWSESDSAYAHGYLVVAMAVYVAIRDWRARPSAVAGGSPAGTIGLLLVVIGVLASLASNTLIAAQLLLPLLLFTAISAVVGSGAAARLAPALAILYFGIRLWDVLIEPLRDLTVAVTATLIRWTGIPAFIDGNVIHIPSGAFEVVGGCSGLNFFIVAGALSYFYGLVHYRRWQPRIVLCLAAIAVALLANWIRVVSLVLIGYGSEMQHSLITGGHLLFGWAVFLLAMAPVFLIARRCEVAPSRAPEPRTATATAEVRVGFPGAVALSGLLLGGWLGARVSAELEMPPSRHIEIPQTIGWVETAEWTGVTRPLFVAPAAEAAVWLRSRYNADVGVYLANYPAQHQGREAVFFENRPAGEHADVVLVGQRAVVGGEGDSFPFAELKTTDAVGGERLVWVGMRVAGVATANRVKAKLWQAIGALSGRRDAQVLVLSAACDSSCEGARELLTSYAQRAARGLYDGAQSSAPLMTKTAKDEAAADARP